MFIIQATETGSRLIESNCAAAAFSAPQNNQLNIALKILSHALYLWKNTVADYLATITF